MGCLPCEKEIIDGGMGRFAAEFLRDITEDVAPLTAALDFYSNVLVYITQPLAQKLVSGDIKISKDQHAAVMAQIDQQCYRADHMLAWGLIESPDAATVAGWVTKIFAWVKEDQTFYTDLVKSLDAKETG